MYELSIANRLLCAAGCDIRADLLLIFPLLAVVSFVALAGTVVRLLERQTKPGS